MDSNGEVVVGLFKDAQRAQEAVAALRAVGFSDRDISLFVPFSKDAAGSLDANHPDSGRGNASLVAGAILGGLGGWLAGVRALAIPVLGPYIAAGATALGAGIGTILFGVAGLGLARRRANHQGKPQRGGLTLVLVRVGSRLDEAERILRAHSARQVERAQQGVTL